MKFLNAWGCRSLILLLLSIAFNVNAEEAVEDSASFIKIVTEHRSFSGLMDEKFEVQFHLNRKQPHEDNPYVYSVEGYYEFSKIKLRKPLVGIYAHGRLTLYNFEDNLRADSIVNWNTNARGMSAKLNDLKNRSGYQHKISISSYDPENGKWENASNPKILGLKMEDSDFNIYQSQEFLVWKDSPKSINLNEVGNINERGYSIIRQEIDKDECRILLEYTHGSRANVQSMCGAGSEAGLVLLILDSDRSVKSVDHFVIESCLNSIYSEKKKQKDEVVYAIEGEDFKKQVSINKNPLQLSEEPMLHKVDIIQH